MTSPRIISVRPNIENLAEHPPRIAVSREQADEIAALTLLISQKELRRRNPPGLVLSDLVPFSERSEADRTILAGHVIRTLQALVLLGWIELPS